MGFMITTICIIYIHPDVASDVCHHHGEGLGNRISSWHCQQ
jgi:hypothetical protein